MSTRKLIGLALACAMAILLAGGVQLVLLSSKDTPRLDDDALRPGQAANGRTVESVEAQGSDLVVTVATTDGRAVDPADITALSDTGDDVRRGASSCEADRCRLVLADAADEREDLLLVWEVKGVRNLWSLAPGPG